MKKLILTVILLLAFVAPLHAAKAIFVVPFENNRAVIPPFESEDGIQLYYTEDGILKGGYAIVSYAPNNTIIIKIKASEETIDAMKADEAYIWLEDIIEEVVE